MVVCHYQESMVVCHHHGNQPLKMRHLPWCTNNTSTRLPCTRCVASMRSEHMHWIHRWCTNHAATSSGGRYHKVPCCESQPQKNTLCTYTQTQHALPHGAADLKHEWGFADNATAMAAWRRQRHKPPHHAHQHQALRGSHPSPVLQVNPVHHTPPSRTSSRASTHGNKKSSSVVKWS